MIQGWPRDEDGRRAEAADWVVRLQTADLTEDQALSFDAWLSASDDNALAYDAALGVMFEVEASAPRIAFDLRRLPAPRPANARRGWIVAGGMAAAATVALAIMPVSLLSAPPQTYTTAKGEHRTVTLADGTKVDLNAGTRMTVTLARHERRVSMPEGEAVFDVASDHSRPFLIAAGDRTVRVVGTRFDVRRREGQLSVTVDRGVVEVRPNEDAPGRAFRLRPGQRLDHAQGAADAHVRAVAPADVYAWRTGRLIYRDQP
ncbi:MAG: FecR family protein, partial [Phenylobacterium sp.]